MVSRLVVKDGTLLVSLASQVFYVANTNDDTGRLERVLSTAISEKKLPLAMSSLPQEFYDLQYSSLDIDEALRKWGANNDESYDAPNVAPNKAPSENSPMQ